MDYFQHRSIFLWHIVLLFHWTLQAQTDSQSNEQYQLATDQVKKSLDQLEKVEPEKFYLVAQEYRQLIDDYIVQKKRICSGKFSIMVVNDEGQGKNQGKTQGKNQGKTQGKKYKKVKLNAQERFLCLSELKALQATYIKNMYIARKRYLDYLHLKRIKELEKLKDEALNSLRSGFQKESKKVR